MNFFEFINKKELSEIRNIRKQILVLKKKQLCNYMGVEPISSKEFFEKYIGAYT